MFKQLLKTVREVLHINVRCDTCGQREDQDKYKEPKFCVDCLTRIINNHTKPGDKNEKHE